MIKNNIDKIPACLYCNNQLSTKQYEKGHLFCSNRCAQLDESTKNKIKETFMNNYGGHPKQMSEEVNNKTKETCLKKYGNICSINSDYVRNKIKENNIKLYGVEHISQTKEFQNKRKASYIKNCRLKYGVNNMSQVTEIADKISYSKREHFYEHYINSLKEKNLYLLSDKEDYLKRHELIYKCNNCNSTFTVSGNELCKSCPNCKYSFLFLMKK